MEMALDKSFITVEEYVCDITRELDKLAGFRCNDWRRHYIYIDDDYFQKKCLPIRIPGGTVGGLYFNDNFEITKIVVDTNYMIKTYSSDINEQLKKFVGIVLDFS